MNPRLSDAHDIERAVQQNHGVTEADGENTTYVVMSIDLYREVMGIGSDEDLEDSLRCIRKGLADVEAGRTMPADEFFEQFDKRHGISR